jgi:hypothetical protein
MIKRCENLGPITSLVNQPICASKHQVIVWWRLSIGKELERLSQSTNTTDSCSGLHFGGNIKLLYIKYIEKSSQKPMFFKYF